MRQMRVRILTLMLGSLMLALALYGCAGRELAKTIVLQDDRSKDLDHSETINIKSIQEFTYEGDLEDFGQITWNTDGNLCLIGRTEQGYEYRKVNIYNKALTASMMLDQASILRVMLSPGGKYIAYEIAENDWVQLMVFLTEKGEHILLEEWELGTGQYMYQWSADGESLFVWMEGPGYEQEIDKDWWIYCYQIKNGQQVTQTKQKIKGNGYAHRQVCPNADGSRVIVSEQGIKEWEVVNTEGGDTSNKEMDVEEIQTNEDGNDEAEQQFQSWLLETDTSNCFQLYSLPEGVEEFVEYTKTGLLARDRDNSLCFLTDLFEEPVKKELPDTKDAGGYICSEGDHIFLIEQESYTQWQLSAIRMQNKEPAKRQVLYKGISGDGIYLSVLADDHAVLVQSYKNLEDNRAMFTVMLLEY